MGVEVNMIMGVSHFDTALAIYKGSPRKDNATIVTAFRDTLDVTPATAQSYFYWCVRQTRTDVPPTASSTTPARTVTPIDASPRSGTKIERALVIYKESAAMGRKATIDRFVSELSMTSAGAQTYFYNCKKLATS